MFYYNNYFVNDVYPTYMNMKPVTIVDYQTDSPTGSDLLGKKIAICAKRGSGKSFLVKAYIKKLLSICDFEIFKIIAPAEQYNAFYINDVNGFGFDSTNIEYQMSLDLLDELISAIRKTDRRALLVFDDCFPSKQSREIEIRFTELLLNPRVTIIHAQQFLTINIINSCHVYDMLLFFKEDITTNIQRLYGIIPKISYEFPNYTSFAADLKNLPKYHALCYENTKKNTHSNINQNKIENCIIDNDIDIIEVLQTPISIHNQTAVPQVKNILLRDHNSLSVKTGLTHITEIPNPQIFICGYDNNSNVKLLKNIINEFKQKSENDKPFDKVVVISKYNSELYSDFVKDSFYDDVNVLGQIRSEQIDKIKNKIKHNLMVIVDYANRNDIKNYMSELLLNGRHYNITYVLILQYPVGIAPELRVNFDYIFMNTGESMSTLKRVYDQYFGMIPDFSSFRTIHDAICTDKDTYLCINNRRNDGDLTDKIFCCEAIHIPLGIIYQGDIDEEVRYKQAKNITLRQEILERVKKLRNDLTELENLAESFMYAP